MRHSPKLDKERFKTVYSEAGKEELFTHSEIEPLIEGYLNSVDEIGKTRMDETKHYEIARVRTIKLMKEKGNHYHFNWFYNLLLEAEGEDTIPRNSKKYKKYTNSLLKEAQHFHIKPTAKFHKLPYNFEDVVIGLAKEVQFEKKNT